jgi:hypothetical protein
MGGSQSGQVDILSLALMNLNLSLARCRGARDKAGVRCLCEARQYRVYVVARERVPDDRFAVVEGRRRRRWGNCEAETRAVCGEIEG